MLEFKMIQGYINKFCELSFDNVRNGKNYGDGFRRTK